MTDAAYSTGPLVPGPWGGIAEWSSVMMAAVDGVQTCAEACAGWQQETARFLDARLSENRRTWAALLSSRDIADIMRVQQEWGLRAATDYTREATRVARLVTSLSLTGTTPAVQDAANLVA